MLISYDVLSPDSKVFIFPASRKFYPDELPQIEEQLVKFCKDFDGVDISFEFKYKRFLIFFISERTPLDLDGNNELIDFVQTLEKQFDLILLDKVNVCFKQGPHVQMKEIPDFKRLIKNRGVSKKTIVFDHMINTKLEYEKYWEVPAGESWLSHFF